MKKIALTLIGCFGMLCSYAQQTPEELFNLGLAAEEAKNYEKAFNYYRQSAEMGNVWAQSNLGYCYGHGLGVEQDYEQAVYWYRLSAGQGDCFAQNNLGWSYEHGLGGLEKNPQMAKYWYTKAAEQGLTLAQSNLGNAYYNDGDYDNAINWYGKIAESAESENEVQWALSMLGTSYFKSRDYDKAFEYWTKAADKGRQYAAIGVGVCYRDGRSVPADAAKALSIFEKVYKEGIAIEEKGWEASEKDPEDTWRDGHDLAARAARQICYCYYKGVGVKKDWEKAAEYYLFYDAAAMVYLLGYDDVFLPESAYEDMKRDLTKTRYYIDNYERSY